MVVCHEAGFDLAHFNVRIRKSDKGVYMLSRFSWDPTLCDLMDCSPPGSSVHGILQARILEWVAMPSSRGSSRARD